MRFLLKVSLIISIMGIFLLILLSSQINPLKTDCEAIQNLKPNTYISLSGKIISEREITMDFKVLKLKDSFADVEITCNDCNNYKYLNKTIEVVGKTSVYKEKIQISASKIQIIRK